MNIVIGNLVSVIALLELLVWVTLKEHNWNFGRRDFKKNLNLSLQISLFKVAFLIGLVKLSFQLFVMF